MQNEEKINVREMTATDFDLIADYWLKSESTFLISMGVDITKIPTRESLKEMLYEQIILPLNKKQSYALIWELEDRAIGHTNLNEIEYGKTAKMHLHIWKSNIRKKGLGIELLKKSLPFYFDNLALQKIVSEPYALNPAPNKTLKKLGFKFIKKHSCIPGYLNFEQEVNRWELTKEKYLSLIK